MDGVLYTVNDTFVRALKYIFVCELIWYLASFLRTCDFDFVQECMNTSSSRISSLLRVRV